MAVGFSTHVPRQHSVTVWVTVQTSETVMTVSGAKGTAKGGCIDHFPVVDVF